MTYFNDSRNAAIVFQNSNSAAAAIVAAIVAHPEADPAVDILTLFDTIHTGIFERTVDGIEAFIAKQQLALQLDASVVAEQPVGQLQQSTPVSGPPAYQPGPPVPPAQPTADKICPQCGKVVIDNREKNKFRLAAGEKAMPEFSCDDRKGGCGWKQWAPRGR